MVILTLILPLTFGVTLKSYEGVAEGLSGLVVFGYFDVGDGEFVEELVKHVLVC